MKALGFNELEYTSRECDVCGPLRAIYPISARHLATRMGPEQATLETVHD